MTNVIRFPKKRNRHVEIDISRKYLTDCHEEYLRKVLDMSDNDLVINISAMADKEVDQFYHFVKSHILRISDQIMLMQFDLARLRKVEEINNVISKIVSKGVLR